MKSFVMNTQVKYCGIFTALLIILTPSLALAQDENENKTLEIKVQDLVVPNAPASAIIGSQISLKPAITPRAFGLSILNSISNEEGEFPNNIAVEFTPYWWSPRPNLSFEDYYNKNGFGQFIPQSLSFSIASEADNIKVDDIDVTKLGLGLRFALIAGKANPQVEQAKNDLLKELSDCLELIDQELNKGRILEKKLVEDEGQLEEQDFDWLIETIDIIKTAQGFKGKEAIILDKLKEKIKLLSNSTDSDREKKNQLKEILSQVSQEFYGENIDKNNLSEIIVNISNDAGNIRNDQCLQEREKKIGELNTYLKKLDEKDRVGLQLVSASAVGFDFRENDFDEFRFRNFATWLTASYRGKKSSEDQVKKGSPIEFLGVARYTLDELEDNTDSFFDVGAGLVYRLQKTPLVFSLEYVRRFGDDEDDRFVGVADYRINNTYSVFLSYGKDFEDNFSGNDDVVTLFGLKVGLGRDSAVTSIIPSSLNPSSDSGTD